MQKDEIKEILNKWKCYIELTKKFTTNEYEMLRVEDVDKILDYITNLQEENKMQTKIISDKDTELKDLQLENKARQEEMVKMGRENSNLRIQISAREEEYMKLQEENEVLKKCLREPRIKSTGVILDKLPVFDIPPQDRIKKAIEYINHYAT